MGIFPLAYSYLIVYWLINPHVFYEIIDNLHGTCLLDAATSSGILKAKQKLGRPFNSDKLGGIAFTKISKLTMCSA